MTDGLSESLIGWFHQETTAACFRSLLALAILERVAGPFDPEYVAAITRPLEELYRLSTDGTWPGDDDE